MSLFRPILLCGLWILFGSNGCHYPASRIVHIFNDCHATIQIAIEINGTRSFEMSFSHEVIVVVRKDQEPIRTIMIVKGPEFQTSQLRISRKDKDIKILIQDDTGRVIRSIDVYEIFRIERAVIHHACPEKLE